MTASGSSKRLGKLWRPVASTFYCRMRATRWLGRCCQVRLEHHGGTGAGPAKEHGHAEQGGYARLTRTKQAMWLAVWGLAACRRVTHRSPVVSASETPHRCLR